MTRARFSLPRALAAVFSKKTEPAADGYREQLSTTTRFFRSTVQLVVLARTAAEYWPAGTSLDVLHIGGSLGCEALSFMIAMRELQPSYRLRVASTDVDSATLEQARGMRFGAEYFTPILGSEGGNPNGWREKWFTVEHVDKQRYYSPLPSLKQSLRFEHLDITRPPAVPRADIVFCQNVLVHMNPGLAGAALGNLIGLLRTPGLLVCAGMDLDLRPRLGEAGLRPVTDMIREVHESWDSHRYHAANKTPGCYFALEDFDQNRPDWALRYSSIFAKV